MAAAEDTSHVDVTLEHERAGRHVLLRDYGFSYPQRCHLIYMMEHGELTLAFVRQVFDAGATIDEAWWVLS